MPDRRGSTTLYQPGASEQLFDLSQEHIRPRIGLIDRLRDQIGAEHELSVIARQLRGGGRRP
jgi:hypothetical protein